MHTMSLLTSIVLKEDNKKFKFAHALKKIVGPVVAKVLFFAQNDNYKFWKFLKHHDLICLKKLHMKSKVSGFFRPLFVDLIWSEMRIWKPVTQRVCLGLET